MVEINRSLNLLYPPFKLMVERGLEIAHAKGLYAYVFEAYRFPERQMYLYAQGRTTQGPRVTWVRPGFSWHQYGVAVDLVFDADPLKPGITWSWEGGYADENGDKYDKLAVIMKENGLEWLGDSNTERAHFQKSFGLKIEQAKQIADSKGILGLWAYFDKLLERGAA